MLKYSEWAKANQPVSFINSDNTSERYVELIESNRDDNPYKFTREELLKMTPEELEANGFGWRYINGANCLIHLSTGTSLVGAENNIVKINRLVTDHINFITRLPQRRIIYLIQKDFNIFDKRLHNAKSGFNALRYITFNKPISKAQKDTFLEYTFYSDEINKLCRDSVKYDITISKSQKRKINNIVMAIENSNVSSDIIAHRGTSSTAFGIPKHYSVDEVLNNIKIGEVISDGAFFSMSIKRDIATKFASNVMLKVLIQEGCKVANINKLSSYKTEQELLGNRCSQFIVYGTQKGAIKQEIKGKQKDVEVAEILVMMLKQIKS